MSDEKANIYTALAAAQAEIKNPPKAKEAKIKTKTGAEFSYKYADIAEVLTTVLPVLSKHGLAILQPTRIIDNHLCIETVLTHSSGETISSLYPVCQVANDHQQMGSAMTYARRYALCSMVGIAAEDDTDAQGAAKAGGGNPISTHRAKTEINWPEIEKSIRAAKTERALDNMAGRIRDNEGHWPASYIDSAYDEIDARRRELDAEAAEQFANQSQGELDARAEQDK